MFNRYKVRFVILTGALALSAATACSSDDDDSSDGDGGRSGSASAGAPDVGGTSGAGASAPLGGQPTEAGAPAQSGGESLGGAGGAQAGGAGGAFEGVGGDAAAQLSDAQILLVLDTLNQGEVEEAYAALPRLSDASVEAFAQQMVVDHGAARQSVVATSEELELVPAPSPTARQLKGESEAHVALLRSAPGEALDSTYIELQVAAHAKALALLTELHDAADAQELTELITTLQAAVHDHHESAAMLQEEL